MTFDFEQRFVPEVFGDIKDATPIISEQRILLSNYGSRNLTGRLNIVSKQRVLLSYHRGSYFTGTLHIISKQRVFLTDNRSGNFTALRTLGQRFGFRADKIDPIRYKDFVVSSTRIRRIVSEGHVDEAGALLGHPYYLDGVVEEGRHVGREIGFPTANIRTDNELVPPHGVYATTLTLDGVVHGSITNIGVRPTFGESAAASIETHVLGFDGSLYDRTVRLSFIQRIRDERRFDDVDSLRAQMEADRRRVVELFSQISV